MTLKEELKYLLDNVLDRIEDIANEDIRTVASLGVVQVATEFIEELKGSKNLYKDTINGSN